MPPKNITSIFALIASSLGARRITCKTSRTQAPVNAQANQTTESQADTASGTLPLRVLTDVPLTGGTTRFDYQSLDSSGRLYIAHLGSDLLTVFDVNKQSDLVN